MRSVRVRVAVLKADIASRSLHKRSKHRTIPRWLQWLAAIRITTDFLIIVLYFSVVLNVDSIPSGNTRTMATLVFATIISLGLVLALRWIAIRRALTDDAGHYQAPDEPRAWLPRAELSRGRSAPGWCRHGYAGQRS